MELVFYTAQLIFIHTISDMHIVAVFSAWMQYDCGQIFNRK